LQTLFINRAIGADAFLEGVCTRWVLKAARQTLRFEFEGLEVVITNFLAVSD
jgi:hypothetical protein